MAEASPTSVLDLARLRADMASGRARSIRVAANLSQSEVAAAIGASRCTIASWEQGYRRPWGVLALRYMALLDALERQLGAEARP